MANTQKENDWRLSVPHDDLQGKMVIYEKFKPVGDWDHEHCEFCWEKISEYEGDEHCGYHVLESDAWICESCFNDFREKFGFIVIPNND